MREKMRNLMTGLYVNVKNRVDNEDGVSTIEWVGLAAVVVALMFAVSQAMGSKGAGLADIIVTKIGGMLGKIGS